MGNGQGRIAPRGGLAILILIAAIIPVGLFLPQRLGLTWAWVIIALLMLFVIAAIGIALGKGWLGILIDPARNMMSLSRLQVVLWTWLILSAFVTVALGRVWDSRLHADAYVPQPAESGKVEAQSAEPLGIQLPPLLWALMGISVTSAVASPLLKADKAQRTAEQDANKRRAAEARRRSGEPSAVAMTYSEVLEQRKRDGKVEEGVKPEGALIKKAAWSDAQLSDLFTGEEVATFGYVDVAKVQNFFFSIIAVLAYAVALGVAMSATKSISAFFAFPDLPAGLVAVIGISHSGYLVDTAVTHSTPAEEPPPRV